MIPALYLGFMLPQLGLCLAVLRKHPGLLRAALVHGVMLACGTALCAMLGLFGNMLFLPMQLAAWLLFLLWPSLLLGSAWLLRSHSPRASWAMGSVAAALLLTATWSMGIEPRWLEVSTPQVTSPSLDRPVKLALVADLQADGWGRFERGIFERIHAWQPDLVLFAGDYLQPDGMPEFEDLLPDLQTEVARICGTAELGCIAVRGDVDPDAWPLIFGPAGARVVRESTTMDLGPLTVTALSLDDARSSEPPVPTTDRFHVVLGHAPDFATAKLDADLLLAGHIHGGQVRIPGHGPLLTLSRVPRAWAAGRTELPGGGTLYVSRGLGMERGDAPRLRMFCRPELVLLELAPSPSP
jgi:uncharacterized protein